MSIKRRIKLNCFTRNSLIRKGKKDAKNHVIYMSEHTQNSYSPFFDEEKAICLSNMHKDYEKFLKQKTKIAKKISTYSKKRNKLLSHINMLNRQKEQDENNFNELNNTVFETIEIGNDIEPLFGESIKIDDETLFDNATLKEFRFIEKSAPLEVKKSKIVSEKDNLIKSIKKYPQKVLKFEKRSAIADAAEVRELKKLYTCFEIFISKCNQHCSLTSARISAYLIGVSRGLPQNKAFNSLYNIDQIMLPLHKEIEEIKEIGVEI